MNLLIKPASGDCNLACAYCFYRGVGTRLYPRAARRMDPALMEELVRQALGLGLKQTIFGWQGGEPTLMGLGFFDQVVAAQLKHGRPGQVVGNALQTNGLLLDEDWARFLARRRFVVGLSLDGPQALHDAYRLDPAGQGSFERVMASVELLRRHNVTFNILAVVNRQTQDQAPEILRFFLSQGLRDLQFIPCLEPDPASGGLAPFSATPEGLTRFYAQLWQTWSGLSFPPLSERGLDLLLNMHLSGQPGCCTWGSSCDGHLVVEHNGDLYPCDFFVRPAWLLGNLRQTPLATLAASPIRRRFLAGKARLDPSCRACPWLAWCHGGCLKDRLPHQGAAPGKSLFCPAYQQLFSLTRPTLAAWASQLAPPPPPSRNAPCPCGSGRKYKACCGK